MKESAIEKWFLEEVSKRGGQCIKLTGYIGIPDRLVLMPGGLAAFVELKAPTGRAAKIQTLWQERITRLGFPSFITAQKDTLINLLDVLEQTGKPRD
jgi:hypothetical protein